MARTINISEIAENSGFETLEEMEQFMRREEFDPQV